MVALDDAALGLLDRSCRAELTRALHHLTDRGDHKIGLVELDPMTARCRDDVAAPRGEMRELSMLFNRVRRVVTARDNQEGHV